MVSHGKPSIMKLVYAEKMPERGKNTLNQEWAEDI